MPVISITLLPGYSKEAEAKMVGRVEQAVRSVIAAPAAGTIVFVNHANTYQRDGKVYTAGSAEELVEFSRGRYRNVAKIYDRFDASWADDGAIVYCFGTLYGHWLDGVAFEGIRFIDRFEVTDGMISRQDVWNDLALHLPAVTMAD